MPPKTEDQAAVVAADEIIDADTGAIVDGAAVDDGDAAEAPASTEGEVDPAIAELNAGFVAMKHPDGGTCDLYKSDKAGNILVPFSETALMIEHGFVLAGA